MHLARWSDVGQLEVADVTLVPPEHDEVQIEIGSAGICGSDLHFFRGDFPARIGLTPGHEFGGTVSAVGADVKHIKEGDLVGVEPLLRCGMCPFCISGDYHVCADHGVIGEIQNGGMAQFTTVPGLTAFKAPQGIDAELVALAEPLACSVHGFDKVRLRGHETVFILGAGSIGLTAILAARANGAHTIVLARHPHQQAAARSLGADEVIGEDEAGVARMEELRRARVVDVAVETVGGKGDTLMQAQLIVRPKGKVVVLGVFSGGPVNIHPLYLAAREVEIIGSMTYAGSEGHTDYQIALDVIQDYAEEARCLVTHTFSLDEVNTAFATALDKASESIKVHLKPNSLVV